LAAAALAFGFDLFSAWTQTLAWMAIFFFASAGASSAYLTASEIFPLETRALAIAAFYAVGTACGGIIAPLLFGFLIGKQSHWWLASGSSTTERPSRLRYLLNRGTLRRQRLSAPVSPRRAISRGGRVDFRP
jgi:MFS family permease